MLLSHKFRTKNRNYSFILLVVGMVNKVLQKLRQAERLPKNIGKGTNTCMPSTLIELTCNLKITCLISDLGPCYHRSVGFTSPTVT